MVQPLSGAVRIRCCVPHALVLALASCSAGGQDDGGESVGTTTQALTQYPFGSAAYVGDIPKNKHTTWLNHPQGVANGTYAGLPVIFFADQNNIHGWQVTNDLFGLTYDSRDHSPRWYAPLPYSGWDHFGDLDYVRNATSAGDDLLYVPIEMNSKDSAPLLVVYGITDWSTLVLKDWAWLNAGGANTGNQAPWVATWKSNPLWVFSSTFSANSVYQYYDLDAGPGLDLVYQLAVPLTNWSGTRITLSSIQGGEMNLGNYLFLLAQSGPAGSGVYVFGYEYDSNGNPRFRQVDYYWAEIHPNQGAGEEFEGITVGHMDPPGNGNDSQVHALLANFENLGPTNNYFKHWRLQYTSTFGQR